MEFTNIILNVASLLLVFSISANGQDYYSGPGYPPAPAAYQPPDSGGYNNPPAGFNNPPGGFNNFNNPAGLNNFNNPPGFNNFNNPPGFNNFNNPPGFNNFNNPAGLNNFNPARLLNNLFNPAGPLNNFNTPAGPLNNFNNPADLNNYNNPAGPDNFNSPAWPDSFKNPAGPGSFNNPAAPDSFNNPAVPNNFNNPSLANNFNNPVVPDRFNNPEVPNNFNRPAGLNNFNNPAAFNGDNSNPPAGSTGYNAPDVANPPGGSTSFSQPNHHRSHRIPSADRLSKPKRTVSKSSPTTHHKASVPRNPRCFRVPGHKMVCLFNNKHFWRGGFRPIMLDPCLCDVLNYEFAILDPKSYEMVPGEPDLDIEEDMFTEAIDLRKENPNLKVFLSLGGWDDSTKKYSELADDPKKRANFITKAIDFLKKHEFDGLDLAWEYPNCWQGAIGVNPKDKPNFVLLLKEIKKEFDKNGLGLSISIGPVKREIEAAYDVPAIAPLVDHINVMTYDMHGPWEPKTGHHTQFNKIPGDTDPYCNVKAVMKFLVEKGAPRRKLMMGIAYYAKTFTMESADRCEMGVPAVGIGEPGPVSQNGGFMLYNELCKLLNAGNWTEYQDRAAGFYACCGDQFACYDPPMMVVEKARWVVVEGFGGLLIKDLSGDDFEGSCFNLPFPLTKMGRMEMKQQIEKERMKG